MGLNSNQINSKFSIYKLLSDMTNQFIQDTKWNGSTECMKIQGDEPSCIPIVKVT